MENLINDIIITCKTLHCATLQPAKIEQVLAVNNIHDGYSFGEHYNFKEPYRKFLYDYLGAA